MHMLMMQRKTQDDMKQNKLMSPLVRSHVQHLLWSSKLCQYSQTIVFISTVTAQLSLHDCLPLLLLNAKNDLVFIQTEAFNSKYNQLAYAF